MRRDVFGMHSFHMKQGVTSAVSTYERVDAHADAFWPHSEFCFANGRILSWSLGIRQTFWVNVIFSMRVYHVFSVLDRKLYFIFFSMCLHNRLQ